MSSPIEMDALILAGGESRRMGQDKSLLPFAGRTLIEHIAAQLAPVAETVRISTGDHDRHRHLGLNLVSDIRPGLGPLMGIASGLRASSRDWTLVVATDIPELPLHVIPVLWEYTTIGRCVVPRTQDDRIQPLFALYHRALADEILSYLEQGHRRVIEFIGVCGATLVPIPDAKIANLNDRDSYRAALASDPDAP